MNTSARAGLPALIAVCCGILAACSSVDSSSEPGESVGNTSDETGPSGDRDTARLSEVTTEMEASLVYRLQMSEGHTVSFYEPQPGNVFVIESSLPGQEQVLRTLPGMGAAEVFAALRPDEPMPEELSQALARQSELPADDFVPELEDQPTDVGGSPRPLGAEPSAERAGAIGKVQQAHSTAIADPRDFVNDHNGCQGDKAGNTCRIDWWNGFVDWRNNVRGQWCAIYHFAGNGMIAHIQAGSSVWDVSIPLGSNNTLLNTYLPDNKMIRRIDLFNAEGDGFHIGCRYY